MEILDILYFMPALVCLMWLITLVMTKKTHRQKILLMCLTVAVPYLFTSGVMFASSLNTLYNILGSEIITELLSLMLSVAMAIMLHLLCFKEFNSNKTTFISKKTVEAKEEVAVVEQEEDTVVEQEEENIIDEILKEEKEEKGDSEDNEESFSIREKRVASMFNNFTRLMVEDKVYLNPDITVNDVAEQLLVGRSTLSNMINHGYGKNFRSVINDYRIYYAKQYMLDNPGCTQEMIAMKCGFKDASAFSHKFKEIVGTSPLVWLTSQTKKGVGSRE